MRVLGPSDGFPALPSIKIALLKNPHGTSTLVDALADHIVASLDNLSDTSMPALAAE
jgi:hypothetical protein